MIESQITISSESTSQNLFIMFIIAGDATIYATCVTAMRPTLPSVVLSVNFVVQLHSDEYLYETDNENSIK